MDDGQLTGNWSWPGQGEKENRFCIFDKFQSLFVANIIPSQVSGVSSGGNLNK